MKYFYDDVIAAMHMAKHYDIKYHWYNGYGKEWIYGGKDSIDNPWDFWSVGHDDVIRPTHGEKYIIHPNSYKILEPQIGDLVAWKSGYELGIITTKNECYIEFHPSTEWLGDESGGSNTNIDNIEIIIQRNGKPFFWPQWKESL